MEQNISIETRNLYICDQVFEFFNILVIQKTINKDIPADIIFSDKNDFSAVIENVKGMNIFQSIYEITIKEFEKGFYAREESERLEIVKDPREYIEFPDYLNAYTDIWINIDNIHAKLEYYNLVKLGMQPRIHLIQEGIGNYTRKYRTSSEEKEWEDNYANLAYSENVVDNYIYRAEAFVGDGIEIKAIPRVDTKDQDFIDLIIAIYGKKELPEEKFIFMENSLYDMGIMSNELELFEIIAKHVGRDNIIVKRHPRNVVDRFTPLGYKIFDDSSVPWEVLIVENSEEICNKVVCSVFSQTCFSPYDVFGLNMKSIMLMNMLRHHVFWYHKAEWVDYVKKSVEEINKEDIMLYMPGEVSELIEVVRYCNYIGGSDNELH